MTAHTFITTPTVYLLLLFFFTEDQLCFACKNVLNICAQDQDGFHIPISLVTLLSCGKTSPGKLNLLEEVILIPNAGQQVKQVLNSPTTHIVAKCFLSLALFL